MSVNKLRKSGITIAALWAAAAALRSNSVDLKHFSAAEFGLWWPFMNAELLQNLDTFREQLDSPIIISPAFGAVGRLSNPKSQHFPDPLVNAVDILLPEIDLYTAYKKVRALELFTGIGVYPDWKPNKGMHLDMRQGEPLAPSLWSAKNVMVGDKKEQQYFDVNEAFA